MLKFGKLQKGILNNDNTEDSTVLRQYRNSAASKYLLPNETFGQIQSRNTQNLFTIQLVNNPFVIINN